MIEGIAAAALAASTSGTLPSTLSAPPPVLIEHASLPAPVGTGLGYYVMLDDTALLVSDWVIRTPARPAGWLEQWRRTLAEFVRLPAGWDGGLAEPPNGSALASALAVLEEFWEAGVQPTRLAPSVEEGILVEFSSHNGSGNVECFNSGDVLAALIVSGTPKVWEVSEDGTTLEETVSKILSAMQD